MYAFVAKYTAEAMPITIPSRTVWPSLHDGHHRVGTAGLGPRFGGKLAVEHLQPLRLRQMPEIGDGKRHRRRWVHDLNQLAHRKVGPTARALMDLDLAA